MKRLFLGLALMALSLTGCSQITMVRTQEMKAVGADVQTSVQQHVDSSVTTLSQQNDSLRTQLNVTKSQLDSVASRLDSVVALLNAAAFAQKRTQAELTLLSRRISDESERNDSRQEEIIYRLDMLLGKSDKILAKKVVVSGAPAAPISMDSLEREAEKLVEAEALYNTARSDYHRGELNLAFTSFKQVYETMKTGELAENSLFWMGVSLVDAGKKDKAKMVFTGMTESFPQGQKVCPALYKLSVLYAEDCDLDNQKVYLQKILSSKACENSPEFEQSAEILQGILEGKIDNEDCVVKDQPAASQAENQEAAPQDVAPQAENQNGTPAADENAPAKEQAAPVAP